MLGRVDVLLAAVGPEQNAYRVEVGTSEGVPASVNLALGGTPKVAIGRLRESSGAADTAAVFRIATDGLLRTPDRRSEVLLMSRDEQAQLVGAGWSPVDGDAVGPCRWMTATEARLLLPIAKDRAWRIRIQARLEGDSEPRRVVPGGPTMIRLRLNDMELASQPLRPGWHAYDWPLHVGMLPRGVNDVRFVVDGPGAEPFGSGRVAVSEVRVVHDP